MTLWRIDDAQVRDVDTGRLLDELIGQSVQIVHRDTTSPADILDETQSPIPGAMLTVGPVYNIPRFWVDIADPSGLYLDWLDPVSGARGGVEFEAVLRDAAMQAAEAAGESAVSSAASATSAAAAAELATGPTAEVVETVLADTLATPATAVATVMAGKWSDGVAVELYGAAGDGVTNDTAAIAAAIASGSKTIRLTHGRTYLVDPDALVFPAGSRIVGGFNNGYISGAQAARILVRNTGGTFGIQVGNNSHIEGVYVAAETLPNYYQGDWITGTGRALIGIDAGADSAVIGCGAFGLETGILAGKSTLVDRANVGICKHGIRSDGPDGWISGSTINFCSDAGIKISGNFWRITNNRVEWNARYGLDASGETTIVGNLFDRNGWAGVRLISGAWGVVVTGNYFCRNGVGGNGTTGRWGWSVPGHASYVATTQNQSCHITIDYQRAVTIDGNRFRAGTDDAGAGVSGPNYILSSDSTSGSTPATRVIVSGNSGIYDPDSPGYGANTYSTGSGAIIGGSDTALVNSLKRMDRNTLMGRAIAPYQAAASGASVVIAVRKGSAGRVLLEASSSGSEGMASVYFTRRTGTTGNGYTAFTNHIGAPVTAATLTGGTTEDTLTITLDVSRWTNYFIEYAN